MESPIVELSALLETSDLAALGPESRTGRWPVAKLNRQIDTVFAVHSLEAVQQRLVRALLLLWHDHLEESHALSQEIPGADGSYVHGIMHRREPDYDNARYWFNRVGPHRAFPVLADRSGELAKAEPLLAKGGSWDPFAFIDVCRRLEKSPDAKRMATAKLIQKAEFQVLLESLCTKEVR